MRCLLWGQRLVLLLGVVKMGFGFRFFVFLMEYNGWLHMWLQTFWYNRIHIMERMNEAGRDPLKHVPSAEGL